MNCTHDEVARRYELDWLRVTAILLLLFLLSTRVFDVNEAFYVQGTDKSIFLSFGVIGAYGRLSMELLFVISGMASCYALRGKNAGTYLRDRWSRLGVPFVFRAALLIPPQAYFATLHEVRRAPSYLGFLATSRVSAQPSGMAHGPSRRAMPSRTGALRC